jgi:hypothetical protein
VVVGPVHPQARAALRGSKLEYVILGAVERRRLLGRRPRLSSEKLAEAVDAADDLAGNPRLELDLTDERAWTELKLSFDDR